MLTAAKISISPGLQITSTEAVGTLDVGAATEWELPINDDTYKADVINYRGNNLITGLGNTSSVFSGFEWKNDFGIDFGTPRGFSLIRIRVVRIPGSASPSLTSGDEVDIVLAGPGLPAFTVACNAPQEWIFIQPPGSLPDLNATTTHLSATVPAGNQGRLELHCQFHAWKDA